LTGLTSASSSSAGSPRSAAWAATGSLTDHDPRPTSRAGSRNWVWDICCTRPHRAFNRHDLDFANIRETTCSRCERTFFYAAGGASYCSKKCEQDDRNERRREQRALQRAEVQRERTPRSCAVCGRPLTDQVRRTKRYCTDGCRQKAYRRRRPAKHRCVGEWLAARRNGQLDLFDLPRSSA